MAYGILPLTAAQRSHELSPTQWKIYSYYLARRNLLTRQCNPRHEVISQETGVNQTSISTIKKELEGLGWLKRRGKYAVELLVGREELEQARDEAIKRKLAEEGARFGQGRPQETASSFEKFKPAADVGGDAEGATFEKVKARPSRRAQASDSSFELFKGSDSEGQEIQTPALNNSNAIEQRSRTEKKAAAAAATAGRDAWKQETVTQAFIEDLVASRIHSREVVEQSWRELAFKVVQRGPDARATKGELLAFCRAKERTGVLPGIKADVVELSGPAAPRAEPSKKCERSCPVCGGTGMYYPEGYERGVARCPNMPPLKTALPAESKG